MNGPEQSFADWFRKNYPGPNTIIGNPDWHAPKILRAARYALKAESDASVAAAYEAAAITAKGEGESEWFNPVQAIRALTPADAKAALEAVRREARAEAFNTALMEIEGHLPEFGAGDPQDGTDLIIDQTWRSFRKIVLALIDKETTE